MKICKHKPQDYIHIDQNAVYWYCPQCEYIRSAEHEIPIHIYTRVRANMNLLFWDMFVDIPNENTIQKGATPDGTM